MTVINGLDVSKWAYNVHVHVDTRLYWCVCLQFGSHCVFSCLCFSTKNTNPARDENKNKKGNKVACRENEETTRTQKLRVDRTNNY